MTVQSDEQERFKQASIITIAGGVANAVLAAMKIGAGTFTGYLPLTASGFHSMSDIISDAVTWVALRLGAKGADHRFHYGHRRIETLMALFAAFFLVYVSVELITEAFGGDEHGHGVSVATLQEADTHGTEAHAAEQHGDEDHGEEGHDAGGSLGLMLFVGAVALVSVVVKETLFQMTRSRGIRLNSPMLIAKAWHHRADSFSSAVVLLSLLVLLIFPAVEPVEAITTIVIAGMILHSAWEVGSNAVKELIDFAPCLKTMALIEEMAENVEGVTFIQNIRIRTMGGALYVELIVEADPTLTVEQSYAITQRIRDGVMAEVSNVTDVTTMVVPRGEYLRQFLAAEA